MVIKTLRAAIVFLILDGLFLELFTPFK